MNGNCILIGKALTRDKGRPKSQQPSSAVSKGCTKTRIQFTIQPYPSALVVGFSQSKYVPLKSQDFKTLVVIN